MTFNAIHKTHVTWLHRYVYLAYLIVLEYGKDLGRPTVKLLNPRQDWLKVFQLGNKEMSCRCVMVPKD